MAGGSGWRVVDPLNLFGGDTSSEDRLRRQLAESRARQDANLAELADFIKSGTAQNQQLWDQYAGGTDDYAAQLASILADQKAAYSQLANTLGNYSSVEDVLANSPQLAQHDAGSRNRELMNLGKIGALTSLKETAEEKLMREQARRTMESQLKAQRDAQASSMKARGVYGGGQELVQALLGQQEAASRRSLEDVAANANAQKRAMSALGAYQQGAASMSAADDALSKFNSSLLENHNQARANARAQDNSQQATRAGMLQNAATQTNAMANQNANTIRGDQRAVVAGKSGTTNNAIDQLSGLTQLQNTAEATKQQQYIAEQPSGGFLSNLFSLR